MKNRFIYVITATAIFTGFTTAQDILRIHKFREPGDTLDLSIQNELKHAQDIGSIWLKKRQLDSGAFGKKHAHYCTPLAIVALSDTEHEETRTKAFTWLIRNPAEYSITNLCTIAWRYAAIAITTKQGKALEMLKKHRNFLTENSLVSHDNAHSLCREMLLSISAINNTPDLRRKRVNELNYNLKKISYLEMWLNARSINSAGGQLLSAKGKRIDWRRIYAQKLIRSQKIAPNGGGYWKGNSSAETMINTALSILIIKEL